MVSELKKEFDKAWKEALKDAKKLGVGVIDPHLKKRINIEDLTFIRVSDKGRKIKFPKLKTEIELRSRLAIIKKIYEEKFKDCTNPYCLVLFKKDEGLFVERLIRSVEICTMNYVLNLPNGMLNINKRPSIIKGRRNFLWEW